MRICAALLALAVAAPALAATAGCPLRFEEVAQEAGVSFRHDPGARGEHHLPETMGAGVAWLDWDGDGWLDLYAVQSGPFPPDGSAAAANRLFRNVDGGRFEEVPGAAGADDRGYGQGVVAADVDGNGATDLVVTGFDGDRLYLNDGHGRFDRRELSTGPGWSSSAALADADGDGDLDLYVTRYVAYAPEDPLFCGDPTTGERRTCDPTLFPGIPDRFLRNEGGGRFVDATAEAGLSSADGKGLGVAMVSLDGDFGPEIYVANDLTANLLFANRGGRFEDLSLLSGAAANAEGAFEAGMGVAVGDVDGDLDPDLAVTNFDVETNTLYRNLGALQFEDVSAASGFGPPSFNLLGFGIVLADLDLDGALDAWIANGHILDRPYRDSVRYAQPDLVLAGDGRGRFRPWSCPWLLEAPRVGRGLAEADFDGDGDPDLAESNSGGPLQLWRNPAGGRWAGLIPGPGEGRGIGAVVTLRTGSGAQRRWIRAGDSYQSASARRALFGLGESTAEAVEVHWPGGGFQRFRRPPEGSWIVLGSRGPVGSADE